jgi:hypothetical protein
MGGLIFNDFFGSANSVATQPKGKIVVTGIAIGLGNVDFSVTRFNNDGSPDPGFGSNGRVTTDLFC